MKKILFSMAAIAAMVGCSMEETPITNFEGNETKEAISMTASIDLDDTRVTVEGEEFTDVKWAKGDNVSLASVAGASATLTATSAGDTDIRFEGEGSFAADVDTYYAVYPAATIVDGKVSFDLEAQTGTNPAILVAKAEDQAKGRIDMSFKPVNALVHVAVSGVDALQKAEFLAYDRVALPKGFTYDFAAETTANNSEVTAYVVNNPALGFFFSLPADLDMSNGYVVRLTDAAGNVCSKAYNGKTFQRGSTTRLNIEWSQPSVSLGTPMTSYSYYTQGNASQANNCANNVIYFPNASTYAGIQNAMVAEAGVIVDGTKYTADFANKSFTPANVTVSSWGKHSVVAYIVTKDGYTIQSAPQEVQITGLPYSYTFNGTLSDFRNAGWATNGSLKDGNMGLASRTEGVVLQNNKNEGFVVSPKYEVPTNVAVQASIVRSSYYLVTNFFGTYYENRTGYVGPVANKTTSNTSSVTFSSNGRASTGGTKYGSGEWLTAFELTTATPYISIDSDGKPSNSTTSYFFVHEAHFRYAQ